MTQQKVPTTLGTEKVSKLLMQYAIPSIIAMTASSLYNMVDSMFIGRMPGTGSLALSGLAISLPLMNISTALGTLVGVGASTMISILLGQKRSGHLAGDEPQRSHNAAKKQQRQDALPHEQPHEHKRSFLAHRHQKLKHILS